MTAKFFSESDTLQAYQKYLEEHFKIIPAEWGKIAAINEVEGGVEAYFENCRTTNELVDRLLLGNAAVTPTVCLVVCLTILFVVVFAVYPFAAELYRQSNIPKRLMPGAIALGAFSFTMDTLPGTPQIQNIIPTTFFKTNPGTLIAERGDSTSLMYQTVSASGARYISAMAMPAVSKHLLRLR